MRPGLEVVRGWVVDEDRLHWRGHEVVLVHRRQTEDLLDGAGHVDLAVVGGVNNSVLPDVWANDVSRAAVTVNVVDAILRVVFLDEDYRRIPDFAMADDIDEAPNGEVVISLHGLRRRRATGMVGADPHHAQLGHSSVPYIFLEILLPDIDAELVGNVQVELRIVLDRVVDEIRKRGVGANRVVVLELFLRARLVSECVVVELSPGRVAATTESRNKWIQPPGTRSRGAS